MDEIQTALPFLPDVQEPLSPESSSTFLDNLRLPIHRWFRYSAGFSADWVSSVLTEERRAGRQRVLDPFAGSGTVGIEAERHHFESIGVEAHPFIARIADAKRVWRVPTSGLTKRARAVRRTAETSATVSSVAAPKLLTDCYDERTLAALASLHAAWRAHDDGSSESQIVWLALVSILRACSHAGTAQWQYILPKKRKARPADPYEAFTARVALMAADIDSRASEVAAACPPRLVHGDARTCDGVPNAWADLVITSPPYANNYDYADATRLEMTFLGEIGGWGDLQEAVRQFLVRSCTQHVAADGSRWESIVDEPLLAPIRSELADVCQQLHLEKASHGGKKPYDDMVATYFSDLAKVWASLRRVTAAGARVCFVIGDSAPYGVYVPVDRWMGELAVSVGFREFRFEKIRDRNLKWKNRKHRVPLAEGRLWVEG